MSDRLEPTSGRTAICGRALPSRPAGAPHGDGFATPKGSPKDSMSMLNYARHFCLLICLTVVLAVTSTLSVAPTLVGAFGLYGALHASAIAVSLREPKPLRRQVLFIVSGATLSMASLSFGLLVIRIGGALPGMSKPAVSLALSSGIGAAAYALVLRLCFDAPLAPPAVGSIALGCVLATLAVLGSRLYLHGGSLWFAAAWWFAFSAGLWRADMARTEGLRTKARAPSRIH